jgi:hypothetical protein
MAREYSKTNVTIWNDDDFRALPFPAQHVYRMLWDHPQLSYCGVVDWRPAKLTAWSTGLTKAMLVELTDCLRARHFIVVDEETEECLVRSWVRWDGLMRQPRLAVSFANAYAALGSSTLRGAVIHEMKKLHDREPEAAGWSKPQVRAMFELPSIDPKALEVPEDPFADGFVCTLGSVSSGVSETFGPNPARRLGSVSVPPTPAPAPTPNTKAPTTSTIELVEAPRADVERICNHLADRIQANGSKRPEISKRWNDAARLMLDNDGRTEQEIHGAIDWCQADEFWRGNILSLPKLREKYDQLRLQAQRSTGQQQRRNDIDWDLAMERAAQMGSGR